MDERKIVPLFTDDAPKPKAESKDERLEEMLKIANVMREQDNNQTGKNNKRNPSKEIRAKRRAKKLARKKSRYR